MKTLILVRHAKSSWEFDVSDKERPLKTRGINDATLVASAFKETALPVDAVYTSPAKRAYATCRIFSEVLEVSESNIQIEDTLYDFGGTAVASFIATLDQQLQTVMLFGHNHAFTSLANALGDTYIDNVPTSGLVVLSFDVASWAHANYGQTKRIIFPRDFK